MTSPQSLAAGYGALPHGQRFEGYPINQANQPGAVGATPEHAEASQPGTVAAVVPARQTLRLRHDKQVPSVLKKPWPFLVVLALQGCAPPVPSMSFRDRDIAFSQDSMARAQALNEWWSYD